MTSIKLFLNAIKSAFTNIGALAIFAGLYALLLAAFFRFIWIREATVWQVLFTYALMVLIPGLFFIYQAAIIDRTREQRFRWPAIVVDAIKFFVATIPVLLIAWLIHYLLGKIAVRYPAPVPALSSVTPGPPRPLPVHWPSLIFASLRFVLWGVALPLTAIHLWIAIAGGEVRPLFAGGAGAFFRRVGRAVARAFSADSVLIYALGLILFFVLPYVILTPVFNIKGNKTEFAVFVLRLVLSFIFSLIGWVITISALAKSDAAPEPVPVAKPIAETPAEAPA